ncbi:hypothetical protein BJX62DRAFT_208481 [Aspergillus germanicus]
MPSSVVLALPAVQRGSSPHSDSSTSQRFLSIPVGLFQGGQVMSGERYAGAYTLWTCRPLWSSTQPNRLSFRPLDSHIAAGQNTRKCDHRCDC